MYFSQMWRELFESCNILQVGCAQMREKRENDRHGSMRIAQECDPDIILAGPFGVLSDGRNDSFGHFGFGENLENLALGEKSIVEGEFQRLGMAFGEKRARNARGPASGQRQLLADRNTRNARHDHLLCYALDVGRCRGQKAQTHQVEQIQLAHQRERDAAGRSRMAGQAQTHAFAGSPLWLSGDRIEHLRGKVQPIEQRGDVGFFAVRVFENGQKHFFAEFRGAET